ncbi:MAG: N-acetylglucosamine-6-phosphate deacetylase [Ruminococcaceae bacterium]|nr:N-acetylglucosamine-6-phosphate deacetylase [Oscillospiraceae bacterium]
MTIIIKNGFVINPDFSGFSKRDVIIENGRITEKASDNSKIKQIDAEGKYVLPGLIDIHNHGALGITYANADSFDAALEYCAKEGITSVLPTLYVNSIDNLILQTEKIIEKKDAFHGGANILGIHVEGPFISEKKTGAMRASADKPTVESLSRLIASGKGFIKVMTIAPEVENAAELIKEGVRHGIRMSIGHTDADYVEAMAAIEAGATGSTHTFNAMRPFNHRESGVLGAVLTDKRVSCEMICDLVHLSEATIRLIYAAKGSDNVILISDNIPPAGLPDGDYMVDGILNTVKDGLCTVNDGKTIAGSIQSQVTGAKNLIKLGIPINEVSKMSSYNPALAIGMENELGSIENGKRGDIIIVDECFNVEHTILNGEMFR